MEEHSPAKTNAIEHFGENVHAAMLVRWTIRHNIQTVERYRPTNPPITLCPGGPTHRAEPSLQRWMEDPRLCRDQRRRTSHQEQSMRNLLLSAASVLIAGLAAPAQSAQLPEGAAHNIVLVHGAFVDQTSWQPVADILRKEGLQRHARRKSADIAHCGRGCHQTSAREAGRQDRPRRPFLGRRGHHGSRGRSEGFGACLRLRIRARCR